MSDNPAPIDVSFIIASRAENPAYLEEALVSMLGQTVGNLEVVLILDGADAWERAATTLLKLNDVRIRYFISKRRRGLARALNIAARLSRGCFLARMDDDDRSLPQRLEKQLAYMREGSAQVSGSYAYLMDAEGGRVAGLVLEADPSVVSSAIGAVFKCIFLHPTVMMRREWALRNKYNSRWGRGQDRELWVRTRNSTNFGCIPEPLIEYRRGEVLKDVQLSNVASAFGLIWVHRSQFGFAVPILLAINLLRWMIYRSRMWLGY